MLPLGNTIAVIWLLLKIVFLLTHLIGFPTKSAHLFLRLTDKPLRHVVSEGPDHCWSRRTPALLPHLHTRYVRSRRWGSFCGSRSRSLPHARQRLWPGRPSSGRRRVLPGVLTVTSVKVCVGQARSQEGIALRLRSSNSYNVGLKHAKQRLW